MINEYLLNVNANKDATISSANLHAIVEVEIAAYKTGAVLETRHFDDFISAREFANWRLAA